MKKEETVFWDLWEISEQPQLKGVIFLLFSLQWPERVKRAHVERKNPEMMDAGAQQGSVRMESRTCGDSSKWNVVDHSCSDETGLLFCLALAWSIQTHSERIHKLLGKASQCRWEKHRWPGIRTDPEGGTYRLTVIPLLFLFCNTIFIEVLKSVKEVPFDSTSSSKNISLHGSTWWQW